MLKPRQPLNYFVQLCLYSLNVWKNISRLDNLDVIISMYVYAVMFFFYISLCIWTYIHFLNKQSSESWWDCTKCNYMILILKKVPQERNCTFTYKTTRKYSNELKLIFCRLHFTTPPLIEFRTKISVIFLLRFYLYDIFLLFHY